MNLGANVLSLLDVVRVGSLCHETQQEKVSKGELGMGMFKLEKQCQFPLQFCYSPWGRYRHILWCDIHRNLMKIRLKTQNQLCFCRMKAL